jgi:transposase
VPALAPGARDISFGERLNEIAPASCHSRWTSRNRARAANDKDSAFRDTAPKFFNKIKQCRRVATRYDKLAANYLAFVKLASIRIWLRASESTL